MWQFIAGNAGLLPTEPHFEALCVQLHVFVDEFMAAREAAGIAVRVEPRVEVLEHFLPDAPCAIGRSRMPPGDDDKRLQVGMEVARQAFQTAISRVSSETTLPSESAIGVR